MSAISRHKPALRMMQRAIAQWSKLRARRQRRWQEQQRSRNDIQQPAEATHEQGIPQLRYRPGSCHVRDGPCDRATILDSALRCCRRVSVAVTQVSKERRASSARQNFFDHRHQAVTFNGAVNSLTAPYVTSARNPGLCPAQANLLIDC